MSRRQYGRAEYRAIRFGGLVRLIAHGTIPDFHTKTDFDQLPYKVTPPHFGFFFVTPDFTFPRLPSLPSRGIPFTCEELFAYPQNTNSIEIIDADGGHTVDIEESMQEESNFHLPADADAGHCVFRDLMTERLMVAECDALLIGPPAKVYGPATYGECMNFIKNNASNPTD